MASAVFFFHGFRFPRRKKAMTSISALRRPRIAILLTAGAVVVISITAWFMLRPERHQHCIKSASFILTGYANEHGGTYPKSDRGWGDAMLSFASDPDDTSWVRYFVGVDDDGARLIRALKTGEDVIEEQCTRIYVQGLTEKSDPGIAILFDRESVKGGDHFRGLPGQERLREVITVDGAHRMIKDGEWPSFVARQRERLKNEGFADSEISRYYGPERN
jgi:hypothetical protein